MTTTSTTPHKTLLLDLGVPAISAQFLQPAEEAAQTLPWSLPALAGHIQHQPATALEVEGLIQTVEDALAPLTAALHGGANAVLQLRGPQAQALAEHAFARQDAQGFMADRAQIEHLFNRFSRVLQGTPAIAEGLPDTADFAAALVLVREAMHHLDYPLLRTHPSTTE